METPSKPASELEGLIRDKLPDPVRRHLIDVIIDRADADGLAANWNLNQCGVKRICERSGSRRGVENRNRLLGVLLAAVLVALGVLAYLYYERTKPVAKIDLPGVSGEITKEGVDIEVGKPKN